MNALVLGHSHIRSNAAALINFIAISKWGITQFLILNLNMKIDLFPFANFAIKAKITCLLHYFELFWA